jgi:hypothetical protein
MTLVSSLSGVPGLNSSVGDVFVAPPATSFRGITPSSIAMTVTPAVFNTSVVGAASGTGLRLELTKVQHGPRRGRGSINTVCLPLTFQY